MGQGRFGHDRILSGVIMCHLVGNNGVFPERGSRGPCVGFWGPGSIWQRMWYFCAKFDWLLMQESDWIIWTNQKITLMIFWLVKNGKDWNPAIPLVKRIFLVPDHIWPKTIKGQQALTHVIRNYVLLLVVPPLCLWWVTHIVTKALRLKILPGQQPPLFPNPPTLLTCHLTGKPGEPCRPALPHAAPSTRDSSTSTSHRGRSDAPKLPTPGRPAGLTSQPNGHTTWW